MAGAFRIEPAEGDENRRTFELVTDAVPVEECR
jgi:hypothetical protein